MAVNLSSGAISKIMTGNCTSDDLKPVLQLLYIYRQTPTMNNKKWYEVILSDGSYKQIGLIDYETCRSNMLQKGSIVQLTKFQFTKSGILCVNLIAIHSKCGIIGQPKLLLVDIETPLVERATPTIPDEDHADSVSTSTQKCSSHSQTQNKKRKFQSSDDAISVFGKDISYVMKMIVENATEDGLGPCYKELGTFEEDDVGACFNKLETLEEDVSKLTRMTMEKNKDVVGLKKLETLEEGVSKVTKMIIEKNKDVDAGFKKLETLQEDVSKLTRMMMEKTKEDVVGFKKLETLEDDVSKLTRMMMEKNKEDDMGACIEKLDKMGWGVEEAIYDTALLLFLKGADYRKLWLHLKPECCGKWIKIAGSIFGLLD